MHYTLHVPPVDAALPDMVLLFQRQQIRSSTKRLCCCGNRIQHPGNAPDLTNGRCQTDGRRAYSRNERQTVLRQKSVGTNVARTTTKNASSGNKNDNVQRLERLSFKRLCQKNFETTFSKENDCSCCLSDALRRMPSSKR